MPKPIEGRTFTFERTFTPDEVSQFGDLTGDSQPLHTEPDEEGRLVLQGLLTASVPTKIGSDHEVMARRMTFEFIAPVYTGDSITCTSEITSVNEQPDRYDIDVAATCWNQDGARVLAAEYEGLIWR